MSNYYYICIDLKSFYASVECVERGLDPMTAKLVVADPERSVNTICLAVSPTLKKLGVHNRCRMRDIPNNLDYITARPRMQKYIDYSARIYGIYLSYFAKEDIHVYSIDEAFMDVTAYLRLYNLTPRELGRKIMRDILEQTGIRATCGIGTNLYLTKVALDITAKHSPDFIGELDEQRYIDTLWKHRPLTDFWRIGRGIAARLANYAIYSMEDIAHTDEEFLYRLFGVDAELLIDHAWGREPVTMADIKAYRSHSSCLSSCQVLMSDYPFDKGLIIVKEMADQVCLDMLSRKLVAESFTLYIGYSGSGYDSGTCSYTTPTNSASLIIPLLTALYMKLAEPSLTIRRIGICCNNTAPDEYHQMDLFMDSDSLVREQTIQQTMLDIKDRFGSDALLRGTNFEEGAMTRERNHQIGGHRSGN